MIVFEDRIEELVGTLPQIDGFDVGFEWVKDVDDVNRYLALKDQPYPIIFLITSEEKSKVELEGVYNETERDCTFILATRELDINLTNSQRMKSSYSVVLNPLAKEFLEVLEFSGISRLPNGFGLERVPNYSQADKNGQIDIWDTIVLKSRVNLNNNCLN